MTHLFANIGNLTLNVILLSNIAPQFPPNIAETAKTTWSQIFMNSQHKGRDDAQGYIHFPLL